MKIVKRDILLDKLTRIKDFVNLASKYNCDVQIQCGYNAVDGKSILGILCLGLYKPVTVIAQGDDAPEFAKDLENFALH